MVPINVVFLILAAVGIALAIIAIFLKTKEKKPVTTFESPVNPIEYEKVLREISQSTSEVDKSLDEFHKIANSAFTELDEKYQELLFLYSLIDEKKKEVAEIYSTQPLPVQKPAEVVREVSLTSAVPQTVQPKVVKMKHLEEQPSEKSKSNHPRRKDILNLHRQGLTVPEIAEELNVGQDMVKLILQLGKAR